MVPAKIDHAKVPPVNPLKEETLSVPDCTDVLPVNEASDEIEITPEPTLVTDEAP